MTGILAIVYARAILLLQGALVAITQAQTIAVAASTLVVLALFQPLRRRVQRAVDRRFDRARYDAERTSVAFAERLRDEVDIERSAPTCKTRSEPPSSPSASACGSDGDAPGMMAEGRTEVRRNATRPGCRSRRRG